MTSGIPRLYTAVDNWRNLDDRLILVLPALTVRHLRWQRHLPDGHAG